MYEKVCQIKMIREKKNRVESKRDEQGQWRGKIEKTNKAGVKYTEKCRNLNK